MKFSKIFITIFILILAISCTASKLEITKPDDNFFLSKMTGWSGLDVKDGGKTITIGTASASTNYTFEKPIAGLGGVYKDATGSNYMIVIPAGEEAHTVTIEKDEKETLDKIIDIVGEENVGGFVGALTTEEGFNEENVNNLKANLPEDKQKELQDLIDSNDKFKNGENLGTYIKYPK